MDNDSNEEQDTPEDAEIALTVDYAAKKRRILRLLLGYSAVFGVIACFLPEEESVLDAIVALPILILESVSEPVFAS